MIAFQLLLLLSDNRREQLCFFLLTARGSLTKISGKWFELIWPRDEAWLRRPKLLIRDLAPSTAFALDPRGSTFLVGGTAVLPEQEDLLLPLLAYLNSSVVDSLVRRTTPQFRGDFQKFEPQHIGSIPVLERLMSDDQFSAQLASLAMDVIAAAPTPKERQALESEIDKLITTAAQERGIQWDL